MLSVYRQDCPHARVYSFRATAAKAELLRIPLNKMRLLHKSMKLCLIFNIWNGLFSTSSLCLFLLSLWINTNDLSEIHVVVVTHQTKAVSPRKTTRKSTASRHWYIFIHRLTKYILKLFSLFFWSHFQRPHSEMRQTCPWKAVSPPIR